MRRVATVAALSAALATSALPNLAAAGTTAGDRFIVTFVPTATAADVAAARDRAVEAGAEIRYDYDTALTGFAAYLPGPARTGLAADPLVAAIKADEVMRIDSTQADAPDGLDRIDARQLSLDGTFTYTATGAGVIAYVIDTGVLASHAEFGGRVQPGKSFIPGEVATSECAAGEGHGTHVAGLIGGARYGVAKKVTIVPVRVFGCNGVADVSTVIAGIEWVTEDHARRGGPAVINLSAGVPKAVEGGLEAATRKAIAAGITFVTAAGNNAQSACGQSPARVSAAITVGAIDEVDRLASFSNYGSCVDIFAPGVGISSAGIASNTAVAVKNGTSMAAPFVTGAVAAFLQNAPKATPAGVRSALIGASTGGVLGGLGAGSPNRLLYSLLPIGNQAPKAQQPTISLPGEGRTLTGTTIPVKVSWPKAKDPDGDAIASYRLQRSYDGGDSWRTVALPRADSTSVRVEVRPDSKLRFRVRATDERGQDSSNVKGPTMRLALAQQSAAKFSSGWTARRGKKLSGGSAKRSANTGASVSYRFTGSRIRWIGSTDSDAGKAKVYLDGKYKGTVDTFSTTRTTGQVLYSDSVKPGKHTLKIVVVGKRRSKSTGSSIEVDAFIVLD